MSRLLSQREAARAWGVGRASIQRAIASGELSQTSEKRIDPAEMVRVFGEPGHPAGRPDGPLEATPSAPPEQAAHAARLAHLEAENAALRELLAAKDANLSDLRSQVRLLTHDTTTQPKRRWWPFS